MELTRSEQKQTTLFLMGFAVVLIVALFLLAGCVSTNAQAEADVYNVLAPAHTRYVQGDNTMTDMERQTRLSLLEAWRKRIVAQGGVIR